MYANTETMQTETQHTFSQLRDYLSKIILGQESLVTRLLITLLADGHVLVEGAPGLAKTTAIKTLASTIQSSFHRIQFTPDLLPADVTGTDMYLPQTGKFEFNRGPIFNNILLADEINRAPAKVQSALLEAMAEKQVTVGNKTYKLPQPFMVMATQNPIEQDGTYPLPEAQLDRFLMYIKISYPTSNFEQQILQQARENAQNKYNTAAPNMKISLADINISRQKIWDVHLSSELEQYITHLIIATRNPDKYSANLSKWLQWGASPRATFALDSCARAHAWLKGRDYVSPEDIQNIAPDVLRHRIVLSFDAEIEGVNREQCIKELLSSVAVP